VPKDMEETESQIRNAIGSLTLGDLDRLRQYAQFLVMRSAMRDASGTADDLLSEALVRVMTGERKWDAKVPFMKFLAGCMKSIRWNWLKHARLLPQQDTEPFQPSQETGIKRWPLTAKSNIESQLYAKQEVERISNFFSRDALASRVIEAWKTGKHKEQVVKDLKISERDYSTVVKRIRRRLNKEGISGGTRER
jgi:DNA-directed RNA polymerase specialized sigma24 family protein